MRNLGNDDIQKYDKAAKNFIGKLRRKVNFSFNPKKAVYCLAAASSLYLTYRIYDHWSYRKDNYIDLLESRRRAISRTRRKDLWHKVTHGFEDVEYANQTFLEEFDMQFERAETEIKGMMGEDAKIKNILLSDYHDSKLDLGFFKLHSNSSYTMISKKGDLVKKSYKVPLTLFGVPFWAKKKQSTKKSGRKTSHERMVQTDAKLDLQLACKPINFLNTLMKEKAEQRNLLHTCRETIGEREGKLKERLKTAVRDENVINDNFE